MSKVVKENNMLCTQAHPYNSRKSKRKYTVAKKALLAQASLSGCIELVGFVLCTQATMTLLENKDLRKLK